MKWEREDFLGDAVTTAQKLIGAVIVRRSPEGVTAGRIVECEAYGETYKGHKDDGAHVFKGLTPRTRIIFGEGGHAYVYLIYGILSADMKVSPAPSLSAPWNHWKAWTS